MNLQVLNSLGIVGYTGKLGIEIQRLAEEHAVNVVLKVNTGQWIESERPQVIINVSHRSTLEKMLEYCYKYNLPLIEGTSGLQEKDLEQLKELSKTVPVLLAENFSYGNYLQCKLLEKLAELTYDYSLPHELSIIERHTTVKKDSPSATAGLLANIWKKTSRGQVPNISSVRAGLPVSDHAACLAMQGEEIQIFHRVTDRYAAAKGAFAAANWIIGQAPFFGSMSDVYFK